MEKTFLLSSGVRQGCPHSITFIQSCMGGSSQYKKKKEENKQEASRLEKKTMKPYSGQQGL